MDESCYYRFIHDLYEFNDTRPALPSNVRFALRRPSQYLEVGLPNIEERKELLVEILAFCLMPNHYHLLLRQIVDDGIPKFIQKLGTGYTNYFNSKYERNGVLFQGKYKSVHVSQEQYLVHLLSYIHLNPLDINFPEWRDGNLNDKQKAISELVKYRYSSFLDYIGIKNFPSITKRSFLLSLVGGEENHKKEIVEWFQRAKILEAEDLGLTLE